MTSNLNRPIDSPFDVDRHEETILVFSPENQYNPYEVNFRKVLDDIEEDVNTEKLQIQVHSDGLRRLDDREMLLANSVWLFDDQCVLNSEIYDKVGDFFRGISIPKRTRVVVCMKPDSRKEVVKERFETFASDPCIVETYPGLVSAAKMYFGFANPANGRVGREEVMKWHNDVHEILVKYD